MGYFDLVPMVLSGCGAAIYSRRFRVMSAARINSKSECAVNGDGLDVNQG
ncbi:hypothetical protein [uncultured Deefgea sp.]|nr:hypothetical protein [uncultured Deefgea sp.]